MRHGLPRSRRGLLPDGAAHRLGVGLFLLASYLTSGVGAAMQVSATADPVGQGKKWYGQACANCHGTQLEGISAPALKGKAFSRRYLQNSHDQAMLGEALRRMPRDAPGSLTPEQCAAIQTYLLSVNAALRSGGSAQHPAASAPANPTDPLRSASSDATDPATRGPVAASTSSPDDDELQNPRDGDWPMFNRNYEGNRYSPLAQLTAANAAQLQAVCIFQTGATGAFQSSPVFYNGIGFITTAHEVQAFDGATCEAKWKYIYEPVGEEGMATNRGVALYGGRIFRGTADGHLIALDAVTGKLLWNTRVVDSASGSTIGVAPIAYHGMVFVALAGGDYGAVGHIYAVEANSGRAVWTFDSIPVGSEPGADTWKKGAEHGGGATWTSFALDPSDGSLYAPIGNPSPDLNADARPGSNLYTDSVVALDAATGQLRWYVQQHPADFHDWDTSAAPVLYERDGRRYMAVGSKDGYLYIYDRDSHALVSRTAVTTISDNAEASLSRDKESYVCPGGAGGVVYYGPAYHPGTRMLYVGSMDWCNLYRLEPKSYHRGEVYLGGTVRANPQDEMLGWLYAVDGASGKTIWRYHAPQPMYGGVTPTAGDVVLTARSDGYFLVFDAKDGRQLYQFNTGGSVAAGVSTYLVNDRQYVAVACGNRSLMPTRPGGSPTVVVFSLAR
jgi:alcohol dehydrogenase (cytochrome c)